MKKVVTVAVYEVTSISNVYEENLEHIPPTDSKINDVLRKNMAALVKEELGVDDVVCTSIKHFVTDEEAEE